MKNILLSGLILFMSTISFGQKTEAIYATKAGAIKGYDPVAYFEKNTPQKGLDSISYEWKGATWHFTTTEHKQLFSANPDQYAPQYGGYCAYGWAKGYPAKTDPDAWAIVGGKLYLNYDLKVQKEWNSSQADYIKRADKNWKNKKSE